MRESRRDIKVNGKKVGEVVKVQGMLKVDIPRKLEVVIKDRKYMQLKIKEHFKSYTKGICGDFDTESLNELRGPKQCVYKPSSGPVFAASWITQKNQCQDKEVKPLIEKAREHQKSCFKGHMLSDANCEAKGYPVFRTLQGRYICVSKQETLVCLSGCSPNQPSLQNVIY